MKKLTLHRHSDKTTDGKRISAAGAKLANNVAKDIYPADIPVDIVFHGPLPRTLQTVDFMMFGNPAFDNAIQHPEPIDGLGSDELFGVIVHDEVRRLIKEDGKSNLEAVLEGNDAEVIEQFNMDAENALRQMFDLVPENGNGAGAFHDPTVPMAALAIDPDCDVRSLGSMESITFMQDENGTITVVGINAVS